MQLRRVTILFAAILMLFPVFGLYAQEVEDLKLENEKRQVIINETKNNLRIKEDEEIDIVSEIQELDNEIYDLNNSIIVVEEEIEKLKESIENNKEEIKDLENTIEGNETLLSDRVNSMFKSSKNSQLEILLNSSDLKELLSRSQMMQSIVDYDRDLIGALKSDRAKLERIKKTLDDEMDLLIEKENELSSDKISLEVAADEKNGYLENLKSQISSEQEYLILIEEEMAETERVIAEKIEEERKLQEASEEIKNEEIQVEANNTYNIGSGYLTWPVPSSYRITDTFGWRTHPISGTSHFHGGLDIGAASGEAILAADSGTVIMASWNGGYGNCVMIDHGNGMITLYAHMSNYHTYTGESVEKGQVIGAIGSTGVSTGPHLHFEVIQNGEKVNPLNFLN